MSKSSRDLLYIHYTTDAYRCVAGFGGGGRPHIEIVSSAVGTGRLQVGRYVGVPMLYYVYTLHAAHAVAADDSHIQNC